MTQRHRDIYGDPSIGGEDPGLEFDRHLAQVGPDLVWVAEADDGIVGFVSLIHEGEEAEIEPIIVKSGVRSAGIGRQLLEHAVEQARELGVLCLSVKPVARNEEAVGFFHDAGFRTLGHIQLFMWLGDSFPGQWKKGPELFGKPFEY
jgi:ribosomal protein S18 acetylase RimI-like enzyme